MSYVIISKKINKVKFGKLLPTNVPITLLKLKDFFDTTNKTEEEMVKLLQEDPDIEFTINKVKKVEEKEEIAESNKKIKEKNDK